MKIKNRKFLAWAVSMGILAIALILVILCAPDQVGAYVAAFVIMFIFINAAFIGGNVWAAYIKSKYFRKELNDKE